MTTHTPGGHSHTHHHRPQRMARSRWDPLRAGVAARLTVAGGLCLILWGGVYWAVAT